MIFRQSLFNGADSSLLCLSRVFSSLNLQLDKNSKMAEDKGDELSESCQIVSGNGSVTCMNRYVWRFLYRCIKGGG